MKFRLLFLSVLMLASSSIYGQGLNYELKRRAFMVGITMQDDFFSKDNPWGVGLEVGYDFRKLYQNNNMYLGIGPRLKAGWLTASVDRDLKWLDVSFNTFSWGASLAPSIGYEFLYDPHFSVYLEGEVGIINYNTTAKLDDRYIEVFEAKEKHNSTMNLYLSARLGARMNIASRKEMSTWIGINNQNTDNILKNMNLAETKWLNRKIYLEVGLGFGF